MVDAVMFSSDSEEHYTPYWMLNKVIDVMGRIDLDPCADPRKHVPAGKHLTIEDNGLLWPWHGKVFMNPPYGAQTGRWMARLAGEYTRKRTKEAIALIAARTDTQAFKPAHAQAVCYVEGRIAFLDPDFMKPQDPAPFPSALAYFGPNPDRFYEVFKSLGAVSVPYAGLT